MLNIVYPPIVEQLYSYTKSIGETYSKAEIYQMLVSTGTLDQTGSPTKKALEEGLIYPLDLTHATLKAFKKQFNVFMDYGSQEFTQFENIWYTSVDIAEDVHKKLENKNLTFDEISQVETYYRMRNYDNPVSVGEFKAVNFPNYEGVPDSEFQMVDGKTCLTVKGVKQMCESIIAGHVRGNVEKAKVMLSAVDN